MTSLVPQSFIPGYRLQSGTDLNEALANPQWSTTMSLEATTGGTADTSVKVVNTITNITSATAGAGVTVPRSAIGKYLHIINSSANTVNVYAEGDATINGVAGTFGYDLPAGQSITLYGVDTTSWLIDDASGGAQDYFDTIAALKAVTPTAGQFADVGGYYAVGDGGGGQFYGVTTGGPYTDNGGTIIVPTGGDGSVAWLRVYDGVINVRWFGAKGIGASFDDTNAILAAAAVCNAAKRTGLAAHIFHPGLTLDFDSGTYYLGAAAATIPIECNVTHSGAGILVIVSFAGEVFRIGMDVPVQLLSTATIVLPDVYKPTLSPEPYTGTGVRIKNLNASEVRLGRVDYFDKCHHFGGKGQGTVYCDIYLGQSTYGKTFVYIVPETGGWFNINNVFGGNFYQGGNRKTGYYHIYMDRSSGTYIIGNNFYGVSLEGNGAQYMVYGKNAVNNNWYGTYIETGVDPLYVSVDASGGATSTITCTGNHGLSEGSMVSVIANIQGLPAGTLPPQLLETTPYYVLLSGLTATQFQLSLNKGGTAISFPSGTYNFYSFFQSEAFFEGVGAFTANNIFNDTYLGASFFLNVVSTGPATNNGMRSKGVISTRSNYANDIPPFRGANANSTAGLTLAQFAAYGVAYDPDTQPSLWSTALSPNGLYFKNPSTDSITGRITCSSGVLQYSPNNTTPIRELASCIRVTNSGQSVTAAASSVTTIDINVANVGNLADFVTVTFGADLPAGIVLAWTRVVTAGVSGVVRVAFYNFTAAPITFTTNMQIMVTGRYF